MALEGRTTSNGDEKSITASTPATSKAPTKDLANTEHIFDTPNRDAVDYLDEKIDRTLFDEPGGITIKANCSAAMIAIERYNARKTKNWSKDDFTREAARLASASAKHSGSEDGSVLTKGQWRQYVSTMQKTLDGEAKFNANKKTVNQIYKLCTEAFSTTSGASAPANSGWWEVLSDWIPPCLSITQDPPLSIDNADDAFNVFWFGLDPVERQQWEGSMMWDSATKLLGYTYHGEDCVH